jgi:hypothetical protein
LNKKILIAIIAILAISIAGTAGYYALFAQDTSAKGTLVVQSNVSGVAVTILGPEETIKTGITGANGEVTFTGLPLGTYTGIATKEGYAPHYIMGTSINYGGRTTLPITMTIDSSGGTAFYPSSNPAALIIKQGSTGTTTVTIPSAGFTGAVSLSCTQLPSGVTATFDPASVTFTDGKVTSNLTLTVSSTATKGIYTSILIELSNEEGSMSAVFGLLLQVS